MAQVVEPEPAFAPSRKRYRVAADMRRQTRQKRVARALFGEDQ